MKTPPAKAKRARPPRNAARSGEPLVPALGEALDFLRLIWAVDHGLHRTSKRTEALLGITGPQRLVLRILGRFPGLPAGHLARLLHLHPSTLSGMLKRLEHQGLVRRRSDPRDARRSLLGLTEKGLRFDVQTEGTVEAAIQATLASTQSSTVSAAREVLETIAKQLEHGAGNVARRSA